jgi:hypothetical protein
MDSWEKAMHEVAGEQYTQLLLHPGYEKTAEGTEAAIDDVLGRFNLQCLNVSVLY